jgi:Holliday junction resolvasome RuvABC DNA-binding subunit
MLNNKNEAISALVNIGIGKNLASDLIEKVIKEKSLEEATTENLVKAALSRHYS